MVVVSTRITKGTFFPVVVVVLATSEGRALVEGKGFSEIGGQRFDWEKNDIMAVPNFLWRRHVNTGNSDAVLYTVSDAALLRAIGQYRSQGKHTDGKVVQIVQ